jgi:hypothetical protein
MERVKFVAFNPLGGPQNMPRLRTPGNTRERGG